MNMWKTVSARIRNASVELKDMGESTEGMVESTAKLRDMIKAMTGFDIMEDEETFKSIYDIIVGIGEKWADLSDIQQASLLEKLAGKTQANALASAFNNIDILKEAYNSAEESAGSAMREQAHFEEGIQYSINQFNASVEALSHTLIDSGVLKWFIDLGTTGVEALDKLTQKLTMFPAIITGITAAFSFVKGKNFFEAPINGIIDRTNALQQYTASMNVGTGMNYNKAFIKNLFGTSGISNAQLATQTNANRIINGFNTISPNFLSTYTPNADEIKAVAESLGIVDEEAIKTAQSMINLGQVTGQAGQQGQASFKGLGNLLKSIGKTAASIGATMLISFAVNEAFKAYDRYINKYDNSKRNIEEANTSIENKRKELADLQNDYDKIQDRLTQINSMGGAKLAKDGEKEKLEAQSKELERQIALKEASLRLDARKAYDESNELMKSTVEAHDSIDVAALRAGVSRADYVRSRDLHGVSSNAKTRMGIRQAVPAELEYYRALVEERKDLDKQLDSLSKDENGKYSKELADANGDAINDLNTKIETNTKLTDESRESLIEWSNTLSTAADDIKGYEDFGHILTEDDKATIALAESTKSAVDAMADELIAGDNVSESQEKLKNSVVKTSEQLSAQKTTVDGLISTYNELYSLATRGDGLDVVLDDEQLKKYGNALEYVNGNYKLNTEKLFELAEAHNQEQIALMKHDKELANMQYLQNARDIETLTQKLKEGDKVLADGTSIKKRIADLRDQNLAIIEQNKIADYQISQLENVTSAYQKWLAVSGQETDAKAFTGVQDASKSILDLLEKGKIGLDSYKMAVDFVIPEDISSQGEVAIQKYVKNLQKYFTEDRTGVDKFLEESSYFTRGEKGYELQEGTSVADIAKDMGWTIEVTRAMIDQLETFGGEFKWNIDGMFSDTDKLVHYQEELAKINEEKETFNMENLSDADKERLKELDDQADSLIKKIDELQGKVNKTTFDKLNANVEESGGIDAVATGYKQLQELGADQQTISDYVKKTVGVQTAEEIAQYTDAAEKDIDRIKEKMATLDQQFKDGKKGQAQYEKEYQKLTDELQDKGIMLEMLNEVLLEDNGVSTEKTVANIASILETISGYVATIAGEKPSKPSTDGSKIQKGTTGVTKDKRPSGGKVTYQDLQDTFSKPVSTSKSPFSTIFVKADTSEANKNLAATEQQANKTKGAVENIGKTNTSVNINDNFSAVEARAIRLGNTIANVIRNLGKLGGMGGGTTYDSSTSPSGAHQVKGNAFARGNDIVGEQGRELVVDPNRGIWYTVGDSGTEMIDLPKDAIVYSHNQTEALLRSGVTTRGKSKGRSFANGTEQQYIFGNIDLRNRQVYTWPNGAHSTVLGASYGVDELSFAVATLLQGNDVRPLGQGEIEWYLNELVSRSHDPETIYALDRQGFTDDARNWLHDLIAYVGTDAAYAEYVSSIMHVISDEYERSIGTYARGNAFANGTLVGERGRELIVDPNTGRWYTVGDYGSEMINLPKDAIVYNHQQTEDLLKNGHTGRGHSTGASFAEGNAYAHVEGTDGSGGGRSNGSDTSSGYVPYAPKTAKAAEKSAKSAEKSAKAAEKAAEGAKDAADEAKTTIDWIDRAIEYQTREIKKWKDIVDDEYEPYENRFDALDQYTEQLIDQQEVLYQAIERRNEKFEEDAQKLRDAIGEEKAEVILERVVKGDVDPLEWLEKFEDEFGKENAEKYYKMVVELQTDQKNIEAADDAYRDNIKEQREAEQERYKMRLNIIKAEKENLDYEMDLLQHNLDMKDILGKMVVEQDYQDMIDQTDEIASNLREQLEVLEEQADSLDPTSEAYASVQSDIHSIKKDLLECEKNQAEWNDKIMRLPIERIDRYINMLNNIKKDLENWSAEQNALGIDTTAKTIEQRFDIAQRAIKKYNEQIDKYRDLLSHYEYGSDKFEETANSIQDCEDNVSSLIQEMRELNIQFLKLPIDDITKANEKLQNINAAEQRVLDDYDTALSAVLSKFDQLIDKRNDEIDILNKRYDEMIKPYQDQLDLLNEQNEAKQMQYNIDKAQYDLDKARQQRNVQVVRNGRIVYESDPDALKSAQDNLNNAKHDKAVYDLQQQIDALEKERDSKIEPLEKEIEKLEDARNRWQTFEDERTFEKEAAEAVRLLGANWEKAIEGTITNPHSDDREYDIFSKNHIQLDRQITNNEKQIENNERMIDLMTRYVDAYMSGEMTYEEARSQYDKLYKDYQSGATLTSQESLAAELAFNRAKDMGDALRLNNTETKKSYDSFLGQLEKANEYNKTIDQYTKTWDEINESITKQLAELERLAALAEEIAAQRRSSGSGSSSSGDSDGGGEWSKNPTGYGAGTKYNPTGSTIYGSPYSSDNAVRSSKSIYIDNSGGDTTVESKSTEVKSSKSSSKSHYNHSSASGPASDPELHADGLAGGIIGNIPPTEKFKKLQAMGLKPLEPDEVPAFLHVGEGVVNAIQQSNILKSVGNAFKAGVASIPTDAVKSVENNYNFDCQFGDFILPNVEDTNGFASAMKNNFESIMNQQFSKIF